MDTKRPAITHSQPSTKELSGSTFVLAVQKGQPTYIGMINPNNPSDRWIFNQLKRNHSLYQFKSRADYQKGMRIWKRFRSNTNRGTFDEWILGRYQGLIQPLGYDAKAPLSDAALETIQRDYRDGISAEKLAADWDKSVDAIKRIVGIRRHKLRCKPQKRAVIPTFSDPLSIVPSRVVPKGIGVTS